MTLAKHFASIEALKADEKLRQHFNWLSKQRVDVD
jgi:hypothetical protein